jgi:predicted dinucleotide-binding enzyme
VAAAFVASDHGNDDRTAVGVVAEAVDDLGVEAIEGLRMSQGSSARKTRRLMEFRERPILRARAV